MVDTLPTDRSKVFFGAWVSIEHEDGKQQRLRIVGPDEFDLSKGYLSIDSPMARALLGKSVNDEVIVNTPGGESAVWIAEIAYSD